ncbi:hypothetical protein PF672P1_00006 [Parabacteroides phage PF672P1]|nr:hypothetical protein PF672P1_00006 [Parabacteroides phage PF672P1]
MNTLEKKVIKTVLRKLGEVNCDKEELSEPVSWLKSLLSNDTAPKECISVSSNTHGCEGVDVFIDTFRLYPSVPEGKNISDLDCIRVSSKSMYANYKMYCIKKGVFAMGAKGLSSYLKSLGFIYKPAIKIGDRTTSGYELLIDKGTYFNNSIISSHEY